MTLLYLDNAATTPIHPEVKQAMLPYLVEAFGNPSSKYYELATDAQLATSEARQHVAKLINCQPDEIIFTSGATESNNFIIKGITAARSSLGKHIITTNVEHPSVLATFHYLQDIGFTVTILPVNEEGCITTQQFQEALTPQTIFASIQWGNNEIGALHPIEAIANICLRHNIFLHCDATQVVGKLPVDVTQLQGINALSLSAHKFFGPKGVGATFLRKDQYGIFPTITPLIHGGGQEQGLRSGTLAVHNIVGLGKASEIALQHLAQHQHKLDVLEQYLITLLHDTFGEHIHFNHHSKHKIPGIISVRFSGINNELLVKKLAPIIAVSTGSACSSSQPSHVLAAIGLSLDEIRQTIRISLSPYLDKEALDLFKTL